MTIKQNIVTASKYSLKCPYAMTPVGLCVHNTANDASAKNEISYMVSNTSQTSFHFAVDDIEAWQGLPLDRNGWHAGDGASGQGNRKYIGIEICYSKSGGEKFTKAESNAIDLIVQLLKERNWTTAQVKKHQDFSGKYCPHRTLDLGWERFINTIKERMGAMGNELDACLKDRQKFWDERDSLLRELNAENVEGGIAAIRGLRSRSTDLGNQVGTLQAEVNNRKEQSGRIESQLLDTQAQLKLTDEQLQKALVDLKERSIEKGALAIEVEQLKVKIESLKQAQTEGGVTLTIGEVLRLILKQKITIKK